MTTCRRSWPWPQSNKFNHFIKIGSIIKLQFHRDIESSTAIIEHLKGGKKGSGIDPLQKSILQLRGELQEAKHRIKDLEEDLKEATENATDKAEELSDLIARMREYESGERGLEQANAECAKLGRQVKVRDQQIERLTEEANQLQFRNGELTEQLAEMRLRLGLPAAEQDEEVIRRRGGERPKALIQVSTSNIS